MTSRYVRLLLVVLLTAYLSTASLFSQQKKISPPYRVTGIVVNSRDNSPVLHSTIAARLVGGGRGVLREPVAAETDERGRFTLSLPSPGNWQLTATARNIHTQPLDGHDGYFTGIILTPSSPSYDVVFHVVPDAVLTGVVTDEAGESVRNAQVTLFSFDPAAAQSGGSAMQQRQSVQTDDRGHFEMAGLDPGRYMVQVQARPWYASANSSQGRSQVTSSPAPDPSLDVVYPATWYPGVSDASTAGILMAHPGDVLQADFRLTPEPSAHLIIPSPAPQVPQSGRPNILPTVQNPSISLLLPDGTLQQVFGQISRTPNGDLDISGLAPGTYQVSLPGSGPGTSGRTSVHLQSGSSTALNAASPETSVTIAVDGGTHVEPSQIILVDRATGQSFSSFERPGERPGGEGRPPAPQGQGQRPEGPATRSPQAASRGRPGSGSSPGFGSRGRSRASTDGDEITFQVPPGQYDVTIRNDSSAFVTGITATKGASAVGRSVTIPDGAVHLTVHLASGFATVSGIASLAGKPSVGALTLLIPATLGHPASLTVVRRDQTNSDGSFHLENVIPGEYILLAIDHGWSVNWTDPATLRPYLMHGMPLDLRSSSVVNQKLTSLLP